MIRFECDKCGRKLSANDAGRYIVKLEVYAAAGPLDLDEMQQELAGTSMADLLDELATADPDDVEDRTYRAFRFDLCDACRKVLIARPLGG